MNRYYFLRRPHPGVASFPPRAKVSALKLFGTQTYVPGIGTSAWGYVDFAAPIARGNQITYNLLSEGGIGIDDFRKLLIPVVSYSDIDSLNMFVLHEFRMEHSIIKVTPSEHAQARLNLIRSLLKTCERPDAEAAFAEFVKTTRISANPSELMRRMIDIKDSNMVNC